MDSEQSPERVLTQEELDALLSLVGDQAEPQAEKKNPPAERHTCQVSDYDFTRSEKFSREHVRFMKMVHDNYSRALTNDLSLLLRLRFDVATKSVEPISFERFLQTLDETDVAAIVQLENLNSFMLVSMQMPIAFSIADRLLGGSGESQEEKRALTDIDTMIVTKVFRQLLTVYGGMWSVSVRDEQNFSLVRMHIGSETLDILPATESVTVVIHEVKTPHVQGEVRFCLPYTSFDPVLQKVSHRQGFETLERTQRPGVARNVQRNIEETLVRLHVVLGYNDITVGELKKLKRDDVLLLTQRVQDPLTILVETTPLLKGFLGLRGRYLAFRVHSVNESS